MDTLYDQLLALQTIPNAYENWAAYRASLTDFIVRHTDAGASVMILGAGMCGDFDLARIAAHFSSVLLLDRNEDAMREGLKRQGVNVPHISVKRADLLGISDETYRAMCDALLCELRRQKQAGDDAPQTVERMFLSRMNDAFLQRAPDAFSMREDAADYAVCCGVHSQLLNLFPQMANVYRRYSPFDTARIFDTVRAMNAVVSRDLNERLRGMARKGVILGLEESRVGMGGGVEGAAQALEEIETRSERIVAEERMLWPFDRTQGKIYRMRVALLDTAR